MKGNVQNPPGQEVFCTLETELIKNVYWLVVHVSAAKSKGTVCSRDIECCQENGHFTASTVNMMNYY